MVKRGMELVVASSSKIRLKILAAAGVIFRQERALLDEEKEKRKLLEEGIKPQGLARVLAKKKAFSLSEEEDRNFVLGFDQVMCCEGNIINKPVDLEEAKGQLQMVRGKECQFFCAAAICRQGKLVWEHLARPVLIMNDFDEATIDNYLARRGEKACDSTGACQIEGIGIQLVKSIRGSYYAVLGVPLLPILNFLRHYGENCPWLDLQSANRERTPRKNSL